MRWTILAAAVLGGCTASGEMAASKQARADADMARALEGRVAGAPQDCVSNTALQSPQIIDNDTILYTQGGRVWRNELPTACPNLSPYNTMIVEVHGAQLCRNDRFRVIEPGANIPGPYCLLGQFTPYTRP